MNSPSLSVPRILPPSLRRNGKPPACEPCRKSRLRCDHLRPSCGRCSRRGTTEKCIYHPAPMTRSFPVPSTERQISVPDSSTSLDSVPRPIRIPPTPSSGPSSPTSTPLTGFLGSTSYAAVFTEQQANLGIGLSAQRQNPKSDPGPQRANHNQDLIRAGVRLLSVFRDLDILEQFVENWYSRAHGLPILAPVVRIAIKSLRTDYGHVLTQPDNDAALTTLSKKIFQNTSLPAKTAMSLNAQDYASFFVGENLRWEVLGIIVTLVGASSLSLTVDSSTWEEVEALNYDRIDFNNRMVEASNTSLSLVSSDGEPNDLLAWLMYDNFMLMTIHHGDSSSIAWVRMGELATALFAMGLHQPIPSAIGKSIFLAEARKILLSTVYVADKELATFLGRPPRISRRYCACQLPLDLHTDEVYLEGDDLQRSLGRLDSAGWNMHGPVHRTGYIRIRTLTSIIREDILEISLGATVEDLELRAQEISKRNKAYRDNLPPRFRFTGESLGIGQPILRYVIAVIIHLDYLYSDFLVQRTLIRRTQASSIGILNLATELLSTVLAVAAERDRLVAFQSDLSWEIAYYGLPAAGVLAVELLRQHYDGEQNKDDSLPPRSETIQNLSVFITCLDWVVRRGIGNHVACGEGKSILKRILDLVLLPMPKPPASQTGTPTLSAPMHVEGERNTFSDDLPRETASSTLINGGASNDTNAIGMFGEGSGDVDFMTWLDGMDLDMGNWMTFNALWDSTGMVNG